MVKKLYVICFLLSIGQLHAITSKKVAVVGAGPAGIVVVGLLLDLGMPPQDIVWIDEQFNVGRMGEYYETVPGNAKTQMYLDFLSACHTFSQVNTPAFERLKQYELQKEPPLSYIIEPLRDITNYLKTKVLAKQARLAMLSYIDPNWFMRLDTGELLFVHYVVLATGSHPKVLDYACNDVIPLDYALNQEFLKQAVTKDDTVAVVGSAHSAVLILKFLSESGVGRVINFYKKPLTYAVDMGTYVQNQNAGLKGITAEWARNVLEKDMPGNMTRIFNKQEALDAWLPLCTKIIYACGFDRNEVPLLNNKIEISKYDEHSGVIGPRLFGIGIAFPELFTYPDNNAEYRIGLKFFMEYAQRVIPEWMKRDRSQLVQFEELFTISVL
jgi:hypothetical protein